MFLRSTSIALSYFIVNFLFFLILGKVIRDRTDHTRLPQSLVCVLHRLSARHSSFNLSVTPSYLLTKGHDRETVGTPVLPSMTWRDSDRVDIGPLSSSENRRKYSIVLQRHPWKSRPGYYYYEFSRNNIFSPLLGRSQGSSEETRSYVPQRGLSARSKKETSTVPG